jgi:uncharacterized protein with HEPN domain
VNRDALYLQHVLDAIGKIERYVEELLSKQ